MVVKALNHSGSHIRALDTFKANENWGKRKNEKKILRTDENRGWGESIVGNANVTGESYSVQMPDPRSYFSQHFAKNFIPT